MPSMKFRPATIVGTGAVLFVIFFLATYHFKGPGINSYSYNRLTNKAFSNQFGLPQDQNWTHVIWETSKYPSERQNEVDRTRSQTWADMNPYYRHEMITHERMMGYVQDKFSTTHPELMELYLETKDYMLRTDVARYLLLLQEGGVYNDLDVDCLQPIDTWVPEQFKGKAGIVMGIETDHAEPNDEWLFQIVVWTMLAKPNQPFIRFVLNRLMRDMRNVTGEQQAALSQKEVLLLTGPAATTVDFFEYASIVEGRDVTYKEFSLMTEPVLIGEIVLMPIWSFGAGHQVKNSGFSEDRGTPLVKHNFANSWKTDHKDIPKAG